MLRTTLLLVAALAVVAAGCGGSNEAATTAEQQTTVPKTTQSTTGSGKAKTPPRKKKTRTSRTTRTTAPDGGSKAPRVFTAVLTADSHTARAGESWHFTLTARTSKGKPVGGTAIVQVLVNERVVDTLGWFAFDGSLRKKYSFSRELRGARGVVLQAQVIGAGGSKRVRWPVRVA